MAQKEGLLYPCRISTLILCREEEEKTLSSTSLSPAAGNSQGEGGGLEDPHRLLFQLPQQSSRSQPM